MDQIQIELCPDAELSAAVELTERDEAAGRERVAALTGEFPTDPRLHFLYGSLLAAAARYAEARIAMQRAIEIAPGYEVARFQLGLLELSSGDAAAADLTFQPLAEAESEEALPLFARGLRHLARDELAACADLLRRGIAVNREHPLISRDMELILAKVDETPAEAATDVSAAHLLLQQYANKSTKH